MVDTTFVGGTAYDAGLAFSCVRRGGFGAHVDSLHRVADAIIDWRPVIGGPGPAPQRTTNHRVPDRRGRRTLEVVSLRPAPVVRMARRASVASPCHSGWPVARHSGCRCRHFWAVVVAGF